MKICRNELLLLGGMYQLVAFIVAMFNSQFAYAMGGVLYILFWVAVYAYLPSGFVGMFLIAGSCGSSEVLAVGINLGYLIGICC